LILEVANIAAITYDDLENNVANVYSTIRNTNTVSISEKKYIELTENGVITLRLQ